MIGKERTRRPEMSSVDNMDERGVAQMVLQIRKDVVEAIGWGPSADDSDDD